MFASRVVLVGKPDCHLCADARAIIERVCSDLEIDWQELSILDDAQLADQYWEQIPVTFVDGSVHDIYRVNEARLRSALD